MDVGCTPFLSQKYVLQRWYRVFGKAKTWELSHIHLCAFGTLGMHLATYFILVNSNQVWPTLKTVSFSSAWRRRHFLLILPVARQDVSKHIEKLGENKQEHQERFGSERPQGIFATKADNEIMGLELQLLSLEKSPDSTDWMEDYIWFLG